MIFNIIFSYCFLILIGTFNALYDVDICGIELETREVTKNDTTYFLTFNVLLQNSKGWFSYKFFLKNIK